MRNQCFPHSPLARLAHLGPSVHLEGADDDIDAALAFLYQRFLELSNGRRVAMHVTCALDSESVRQLWPWGLLRDHAARMGELLFTPAAA